MMSSSSLSSPSSLSSVISIELMPWLLYMMVNIFFSAGHLIDITIQNFAIRGIFLEHQKGEHWTLYNNVAIMG
jgi:hypothetical protein